jgi:hypothetical protein
MTAKKKIAQKRLTLLQLAEKPGNISAACREKLEMHGSITHKPLPRLRTVSRTKRNSRPVFFESS